MPSPISASAIPAPELVPIPQIPYPRISIPQTDPDDVNYRVPGDRFTGVVGLSRDGTIDCSGGLIYNGRHILTAAHCFNNPDGTPNLNPDPQGLSIVFDLPDGRITRSDIKTITIHPGWTNDPAMNNDIALIELEAQAPDAADRYQLYGESNEVGQNFDRVGYGIKATGFAGEVDPADDPNRLKRAGLNRYDAISDIFASRPDIAVPLPVVPGTQLAYDFDNGNPANDAFGQQFGIVDLGLGFAEVAASSGDSGSPSLINGAIVGISSYGLNPAIDQIDFTGFQSNNSSFGEFFVDTRVSAYLGFINETLALANAGNTIETGTTRNDTLVGNQGNDSLRGGAGNDILIGGSDSDVLFGEGDDDILYGNRQADALDGGDGFDALFGGQDSDTLSGGAGDDRLHGDRGQDVLTGGPGRDRYIIGAGDELDDRNLADIITDFSVEDEEEIILGLGLTAAELVLEPSLISGLGVTLRVRSTGAALAFVQGVTVEDLAGRIVTAGA
jgi:Ca2+-binding RTX toxin-like protein